MSDSQKAINSDVGGIKTKWIIVTICLIVLIVLGLYFVNFPHHLSDKNEVWGTFGDYFGGILNPVIAAFAFYLIAKSYELQKRELEEARKLLEISSDEQGKQIKLAAWTALLSSNLTKISMLVSEKVSLLQGILPAQKKPTNEREDRDHGIQLIRNHRRPADGVNKEKIVSRLNEVESEIDGLTQKNCEIESHIASLLN